jgi:hypothetical protein
MASISGMKSRRRCATLAALMLRRNRYGREPIRIAVNGSRPAMSALRYWRRPTASRAWARSR